LPVYTPADADAFHVHGSRFCSYVRTERGASTLCAWRLEVEPDLPGVAHRPSHEEVILMLEGSLRVTLDGVTTEVAAGDVIHVPADSELKVDGGPVGARAWVTTTAGLQALVGDGERMSPPWAQ
jgi:quercetin dioxygenase-like cupin family protein